MTTCSERQVASISDFGEGEPSERHGSFPFPRRSMELFIEVSKAKATFLHGGRPLKRLLLNTRAVFTPPCSFERIPRLLDDPYTIFAGPIGSSAYPFACCDPTCTKPRSGFHPRNLSQNVIVGSSFANTFLMLASTLNGPVPLSFNSSIRTF